MTQTTRNDVLHGGLMLVLSRHRDQSIMINDNIEVVIVDIRGDKVRLGVRAPKEVSVHRKEIYDAIRAETGGIPEFLEQLTNNKLPDEQKPSI